MLPSGKTIAYGYNTNGQVMSVTLNGSPNVTILSNVTYDPFGPITGWTWGNSTTASRTFDSDGKLTQVTSSGQRTFGYDDAFRITAANDVATPANSWTLGYDILDRLNSATKTATTIGYTYDADGNRLTQTGTSASTYTIPGTSNKLSSVAGVLARTYSYDSVGNALTTGVTTHTYYNSGRMKTGKLNAASPTTYIYNALGQRVKKSGGPQATTVFMYDEAGHLVGEYTISAGAAVRVQETVWLGDIPIATLRTNGANVDVFYVHTDQLNTPRKVSRPSDNKLRWSWDPTPFGEGAPNENPSVPALGVFKYNLRFPGQYFDLETGLNYNYFRDYDPAKGGYVQSDPIGLAGGTSTYAFVNARPISYFDPFGLAIYRGQGNYYSDIPPPGPCEVATMLGDYVYHWAQCDFGQSWSGCPPESGTAYNDWMQRFGPYGWGHDGQPKSHDQVPQAPPWSVPFGGAFSGNFSYTTQLGDVVCTAIGNWGTGGEAFYAGCGPGFGNSVGGRAQAQGTFSVGDPTGWGLRLSLGGSAFGQSGSLSIYATTSGATGSASWGPGSGRPSGNVTFGHRSTRGR